MNTPKPEDYAERIEEALLAGRKLHAIKLYCEFKQVGLAEAKREMDRREKDLWAAHPEKFKRPPGRGCAAMLLLMAALTIAGVFAATRW